jgi:hypothetical protein
VAEKGIFYKINSSDLIIIILILVISTGIIFVRFGQNQQASEAFVYHQGKLLLQINMSRNDVYKLSAANMKIEIENRRIRVLESDCPKSMCMRKGWIQTPGDVIVCVPNKVLIEIRSQTADFLDAVVD